VNRRIVSSLAALAVAALPVSQAWSACYTPGEATAVHMRMLQSELMVAALACRDSNPELGMITKYNAFVNRHSTGLVTQSRVLERHFDRHYGPQAKRRMDVLLTALANDASKRSMTADFCGGAASLFGMISVMEWPQLLRLAGERANGSSEALASCAATGVREGMATR
jgi:hypothetical protein